ncbi:hypothetical protein UI24_16285 [Mycobacteroides franklinii]|nr:hypothetical protein [Mycobacteroides franklinii]
MHTAAVAAVVLAVSAAGLSGAPAAWAGPGTPNALQVITMLQRQGDKVIVHRVGDKPLHMCTVTSIREGKSEYWWTHPRVADPNPAKRANGVGTQLLYRTMYVDVQC